MIYAGLAMFGLTCLWIAYKRLFRGPLGFILWTAAKLMGSGKAVSTQKALPQGTRINETPKIMNMETPAV
jgi:hypothetical protein